MRDLQADRGILEIVMTMPEATILASRAKEWLERAIAAETKVERMQKVVLSARPLFKFLENAGIYRDLTLPDLAVRPYNDLMTRLEEALAELEAVE